MTVIKLKQDWAIGDRIGGGGFGQVFAAENQDGLKGAVKMVPKAPGADRELLFVDLKEVRAIVPVQVGLMLSALEGRTDMRLLPGHFRF